ncbi:MAG TPA: hypothetical protein PK400_07700 [Phycisphaerales bacterium]|nr:hypothetical protein [Phycisphaerales bacterium]HRQ76566.1 hypothetical protein [Phycisphaerales bacterium]
MTILFNLFVMLLVLLIAYWWANHGLFSAILHLICVIAAGAIAFAFWEPLTVNLLLRGNRFDDYAWGISLVGLFAISLVVLRVAMDKIVPSNVNLPTWANLAFGFPFGVAAGILTIGITLIGAGHIQSHQEVMGYLGYGRSARGANVERIGPAFWLPIHQWTNEFYNWLSVGSLYPTFNNTPLQHYNPDVYKQASLLRDSFDSGKGKFSLKPDGASIREVLVAPVNERENRYAIAVNFTSIARDFGQQLTLSRSQIRLICHPRDNFTKPHVIHPDAWSQETAAGGMARFSFDDPTHYITSVPGRESASTVIEFAVPSNAVPRFIQIRGTRYRLPEAKAAAPGMLNVASGPLPQVALPAGGADIRNEIEISNTTRPLNISTNMIPGTLQHQDRMLTHGEATFETGGERPSRNLLITGILEPAGTRIVQVQVGRQSTASLYGPIAERAGANARIALVDSQGNAYTPIGYIHEHRTGTTIKLNFVQFLPTLNDLPMLPSASNDRLRLLFNVTVNATIVGLKVGDETIGTCNVTVAPRTSR